MKLRIPTLSLSSLDLAFRSLLLLLVAAGLLLRILNVLQAPPLWFDEVSLAANLASRDALGLLRPLEFSQSAPVLFLLAVKACITVGGINDLAFRALPLLASLAQLMLFARLSLKLLPPAGAVAAVAVCAFSKRLLYYGAELKQYSVEAFVATALVWLALRWFDEPESRPRFAALALGGMLAIGFAHTAPFLLAPVGLAVLLAPSPLRRRLQPLRSLAWLGALWAPLLVLNYVKVISAVYGMGSLATYWAPLYPGMPTSAESLQRWMRLVFSWLRYHDMPVRPTYGVLALALPGLVIALARRQLPLLLCATPLALYWVAGMLGKAPFYGRLLVFVHPLVILTVALGVAATLERVSWERVRRGAGAAALALVLVLVARSFQAFPPKPEINGSGAVLAAVKREAKPGDTVHLSYFAVAAHRLDLARAPYPAEVVVHEGKSAIAWVEDSGGPQLTRADLDRFASNLAEHPPTGRTWVVAVRFLDGRRDVPSAIERAWGRSPRLVFSAGNSDLFLVEPASP